LQEGACHTALVIDRGSSYTQMPLAIIAGALVVVVLVVTTTIDFSLCSRPLL
jgi:hypothetical protein